jgi:lysophospholipase L1-like esterase
MPSREIVACLGSSSTAGKGQAFDCVGELARRPCNARFDFRNFGVGGDLAYNAIQRLDTVLAINPDRVIVWVGGNDALAMVSVKARRLFQVMKSIPRLPSEVWFEDCFRTLARRLKAGRARVALCSLAPIGEAPKSVHPFQSRLNSAIRDLSAIAKRVAGEEHCAYVPIFEAIQVALQSEPGPEFTNFRLLPFYRDAFRTLVLRTPIDQVARLNGWHFHSDGIHLNERGGLIAAELIQSYLNEVPLDV